MRIVDRVHAFDKLLAENKSKEGERTERAVMLKHDMHRLDAFLNENPQVRMIVFDPLMNFKNGADPNDAVELRAVLTGLKALAEKHRLSILIVAHTRKSSEGPAIDRLAGSGALQQVSRSVLLVGKHPDDTDADNRSPPRVLLTVKNNEIAEPVILSFKIETAHVSNGDVEIKTRRAIWGERLPSDAFTPEQVLDGRAGNDKEGKIAAAVKWLREHMVPMCTPLREARGTPNAHSIGPRNCLACTRGRAVCTTVGCGYWPLRRDERVRRVPTPFGTLRTSAVMGPRKSQILLGFHTKGANIPL